MNLLPPYSYTGSTSSDSVVIPAKPGSPQLRQITRDRNAQTSVWVAAQECNIGAAPAGDPSLALGIDHGSTGARLWAEFLKLRMTWDVKCRSSWCYVVTGRNLREKWQVAGCLACLGL